VLFFNIYHLKLIGIDLRLICARFVVSLYSNVFFALAQNLSLDVMADCSIAKTLKEDRKKFRGTSIFGSSFAN